MRGCNTSYHDPVFQEMIFEYKDVFYNRIRRHAKIDKTGARQIAVIRSAPDVELLGTNTRVRHTQTTIPHMAVPPET